MGLFDGGFEYSATAQYVPLFNPKKTLLSDAIMYAIGANLDLNQAAIEYVNLRSAVTTSDLESYYIYGRDRHPYGLLTAKGNINGETVDISENVYPILPVKSISGLITSDYDLENVYIGSKYMASKLGLDLKGLTNTIKSQPEASKIANAAVIPSIPLEFTDSYEATYIFDYLKDLANGKAIPSSFTLSEFGDIEERADEVWARSINLGTVTKEPMDSIYLNLYTKVEDLENSDDEFGYRFLRVGEPVEEEVVTSGRESSSYLRNNARIEGKAPSKTVGQYHIYHKKDGKYTKYVATDVSENILVVATTFYGTVTDTHIPLLRDRLKSYPSNFGSDLATSSIRMSVLAWDKVEYSWYQTLGIEILLELISFYITVTGLVNLTKGFIDAVKKEVVDDTIAKALSRGFSYLGKKVFLGAVLVLTAAKIAEEIGGDLGRIVAAIIVVVGGRQLGILDFSQMGTAEAALAVVDPLVQTQNIITQAEFDDLNKEIESFTARAKAYEEDITEVRELLGSEVPYNAFRAGQETNDYLILESVTEFYNRTLKVNPGVDLLNGASDFVANKLKLPKDINSLQNDLLYADLS